MHEQRYHGTPEHLRAPERVGLLEIERVVNLSLAGLIIQSALDVGSGTGLFAEAFAVQGLQVAGVDPNPEMLRIALDFMPQGRFQQALAEDLPFADESFDLVFLGHVLHEADDPLKALKEARRVSRQRTVILEWPYREDEDGPPLRERLKPETMQALIRAAGFRVFERITLKHMELYRLER